MKDFFEKIWGNTPPKKDVRDISGVVSRVNAQIGRAVMRLADR